MKQNKASLKFVVGVLCLLRNICGTTITPQSEEFENRKSLEPSWDQSSTYLSISENTTTQKSLEDYQNYSSTFYDQFPESNIVKRDLTQDKVFNQKNYYDLRRVEGFATTKNPAKTVMFRTYGKGQAIVTKQGQTVLVPNELGGRNVMKVTNRDVTENKVNGRGRCKECPEDQTVVATKGKDYVLLPKPCPTNSKMWNHHSGPKPGSKIEEGVHIVRGTIGPKKRFCEYQYQVLVRRCEPLKAFEEINITCSAGEVWGSKCKVSCNYEEDKSTVLECMENLQWSNSLPKCKGKTDCWMPKITTKSKIWCQTANMTQVEGDFLPNGSLCRFNRNGRQISLNCKEGTWRITRKNKLSKMMHKNKLEKEENVCEPNPCQNRGTCFRSELNKGQAICRCQPQTQGVHCELRECDYNICYNNGLCFFVNEERTCYCLPEYSGAQCQNQRNQTFF